MSAPTHIPMFPLSILPLPGELVPLHIFEPRYKQLLEDAESDDIRFGIYFSHEINTQKVGSLMRLETVLKKYPGGESDIIVKCENVFNMDLLLRTFHSKMYPGADVRLWDESVSLLPGHVLADLFRQYLTYRNMSQKPSLPLAEIAIELGLDVVDRYRFLTAADDSKETFLVNQLRYQLHILKQEDESKDVFHLN